MINSRSRSFSSLKALSLEDLEALANQNPQDILLLARIAVIWADRAECAERHITAEDLREERTAAKRVRDNTVPGSFGSQKRA